jgi:hypothetical protein
MASDTKESVVIQDQEAELQKPREEKTKTRGAWMANEEYVLPENRLPLVSVCIRPSR